MIPWGILPSQSTVYLGLTRPCKARVLLRTSEAFRSYTERVDNQSQLIDVDREPSGIPRKHGRKSSHLAVQRGIGINVKWIGTEGVKLSNNQAKKIKWLKSLHRKQKIDQKAKQQKLKVFLAVVLTKDI
jgi:hypothetical protein